MPKSKSLLFVELFLLEQANLVLRKKWWAQCGGHFALYSVTQHNRLQFLGA